MPCTGIIDRNGLAHLSAPRQRPFVFWGGVPRGNAPHVKVDAVTKFRLSVARKITRALARIKLGLQDCLFLGNMDAKRDWGHARDYIEMQWLMLQQDTAEDYVIATGVQFSVREFVEVAAGELGISVRWQGQGVDETGVDQDGRCIVRVDPRYFRPTEVETLLGDPTKAREKLGWVPKTSFQDLVAEMVREDLKSAERDELVKSHGFNAYDYHE